MASTSDPPDNESQGTLGQLIKQASEQLGLSQASLGEPQFSADYIGALERGAVRPSRAALELLAARLDLPLDRLRQARQERESPVDLKAVAEDLHYQANLALAAIRANKTDEGLKWIAEAEDLAGPYLSQLPAQTHYLIPFLRARAYYQRSELTLAEAELEPAIEIAKPNVLASTRVHNLLGLVFYSQERPELALKHHLHCLPAVLKKEIMDLNLQLSVCQNLGNDYLVLNDFRQAIDVYHQALDVLRDLDDQENMAQVFWGLLMAYRSAREGAQAKIYGMKALQIYERLERSYYAAAICLNLAEILLDERRFEEAEKMLKKVKWFLRDNEDQGLKSYLYSDLADLALQRGQLEEATQHARKGLILAEANCQLLSGAGVQPNGHPIRTYAEALQVAGLVEEAKGATAAADDLFAQAMEQIDRTSFTQTARAIRLSYADLLAARGAFERSVEYYRMLAQSRPRPRLGGYI